ncbi:putative metal-binding motif-containing protein [Cystobacter fuscus]
MAQGGDCNDGNPFTHPNATELCDLADNDCDTEKDEGDVCPTTPAWKNYPSSGSDTGTPWHSMEMEAYGSLAVTSSTSSNLER